MDKLTLSKHIDELCKTIIKIKTKDDCKAFLSDLCTNKEIEQMALRAFAAKLFLEGNTYAEIIAATELSSATISRVSHSLAYGSGGYKKFINAQKPQ